MRIASIKLMIRMICLTASTSLVHAQEIKFQATILAPSKPDVGPFPYFAGFAPVIDGNDVYYIADAGKSLYRHRDGVNSLIVSNRDAKAPEIQGFVDVVANQQTVVFGASTSPTFGPGFSSANRYYVWSNGVLSTLISRGDLVPGTTNVITDLSAPKVYRGSTYLYCGITGKVGHIVRFDGTTATNLCFTGAPLTGDGPSLTNLVNYSIGPDAIYLVTVNYQIPCCESPPNIDQYEWKNGQLRHLHRITPRSQPGVYGTEVHGMIVDGNELALLIWAGAGLYSSVYRYSGGVLREEFLLGYGENLIVNGASVTATTIDAIGLHRGNLLLKFGANSPLYGYLPRAISGNPTYFSLDPNVYLGDSTTGIKFNNNSFVLVSGAGLVRLDINLPQAEINTVDFDGDGISDPSLFEDQLATWFNHYSSNGFNTVAFGYNGIQAVPSDYDGDGKADITVYDPLSGVWNSFHSEAKRLRTDQFGYPGVKPVMSDYDGDGRSDLAVYDESNGLWYIFSSTKGFSVTQFGYPGTEAVPHDFDGDNITDLAVYDRELGVWYRFGSQTGFRIDQFGYPGVAPKAADFDGDGKDDLCVFDHRNGAWFIFGSTSGFKAVSFGFPGVEAVPADFDGDGMADLAVYNQKTGKWYHFGTKTGYSDKQL